MLLNLKRHGHDYSQRPEVTMSSKPKITKTDAEWRAQLTPMQYQVAREKGTERAFTGAYWDHYESGHYHCIGCHQPLFDARDKFDAGCGWPSYTRPTKDAAVTEHDDRQFFMQRTEVRCARCDAHLGHVFSDGPMPTGLRYCINGVALRFDADE